MPYAQSFVSAHSEWVSSAKHTKVLCSHSFILESLELFELSKLHFSAEQQLTITLGSISTNLFSLAKTEAGTRKDETKTTSKITLTTRILM